MTKPLVMECATLTARYRVSLHEGRMQIERYDDGEWQRVLFDSEGDVGELVDTIDQIRDIAASQRQGRGR